MRKQAYQETAVPYHETAGFGKAPRPACPPRHRRRSRSRRQLQHRAAPRHVQSSPSYKPRASTRRKYMWPRIAGASESMMSQLVYFAIAVQAPLDSSSSYDTVNLCCSVPKEEQEEKARVSRSNEAGASMTGWCDERVSAAGRRAPRRGRRQRSSTTRATVDAAQRSCTKKTRAYTAKTARSARTCGSSAAQIVIELERCRQRRTTDSCLERTSCLPHGVCDSVQKGRKRRVER